MAGKGGDKGKFKVKTEIKGTVDAPDVASVMKQGGGGGGAAGKQGAGKQSKAAGKQRAAG